jgi:hypothetical protein
VRTWWIAIRIDEEKVFVEVPGVEDVPRFQMVSPRLARPELATEFVKEVSEEPHGQFASDG